MISNGTSVAVLLGKFIRTGVLGSTAESYDVYSDGVNEIARGMAALGRARPDALFRTTQCAPAHPSVLGMGPGHDPFKLRDRYILIDPAVICDDQSRSKRLLGRDLIGEADLRAVIIEVGVSREGPAIRLVLASAVEHRGQKAIAITTVAAAGYILVDYFGVTLQTSTGQIGVSSESQVSHEDLNCADRMLPYLLGMSPVSAVPLAPLIRSSLTRNVFGVPEEEFDPMLFGLGRKLAALARN